MSLVQLGTSQPLAATPQPCLHDLLTYQATLTPEGVAVSEGTDALTYRQLEEQSNQLAHILRRQGVGPEVIVGLALELGRHQVHALVALFAILKTGGAVLALSDFYPPATLRGMLEETQVRLVVAVEARAAQRLEASTSKHVPIVCLEDQVLQQQVARQSVTPPSSGVTVTTLAYLIYTSGSTGTPKGVLCEHVHLGPLGLAQGALYQVRVGDRIGHAFNWQFDGIWSVIATAIANGATLCLPERGVLDNGGNTVAWIERERLRLMFCTPSYLATWPDIHLPEHPAIVVAGESVREDLAKRYAARCRFYTAYGPAEAGICLTTGRYREGVPTMGFLLPYVRLTLVDAEGKPVPPGEEGEVAVQYPHARGYTNPTLTRERFRADGYHTGDYARQLPDGSLLFAGRKDAQLKLPGGILVNLEQIEQLLGAHQFIVACKALWREPLGIVLYVVPKARGQLSTRTLRTYLADWLPEPIVSRCLCLELESLPLTPNGKASADPNHYPLPAALDIVDYIGEFRPPTTKTEIDLAAVVLSHLRGPVGLPVDVSVVNALQTLAEHGVDSLTLGGIEVEIVQRWHRVLSQEELANPLYEIARRLEGEPAPFPEWEVR